MTNTFNYVKVILQEEFDIDVNLETNFSNIEIDDMDIFYLMEKVKRFKDCEINLYKVKLPINIKEFVEIFNNIEED